MEYYACLNKIISDLIQALEHHAFHVIHEDPPEAVHQIRVTSRRLRNSLRNFKDNFSASQLIEWDRSIKRLAKSFSQARDLDVQILFLRDLKRAIEPSRGQKAISALTEYFIDRRRHVQPQLDQSFKEIKQNKVIEEIKDALEKAVAPPGTKESGELKKVFAQRIKKQVGDLLKFEEYVTQPREVEKLHKMRIAAKHLRYTLESSRGFYGPKIEPFILSVLSIHRILGELHDLDVWIENIPFYQKKITQGEDFKDEFVHLRDVCAVKREKAYHQFVNIWKKLQNGHVLAKCVEWVDCY